MRSNESTFPVHLFRYDPETGHIFNAKTGTRVGTGKDRTCQYRRVCRNDNRVMEHRLAWRIATGAWPSQEIDHINGDKHDNRLCNLREATECENHQNVPDLCDHRGAYWCRHNKCYRVAVQAHGKRKTYAASTYFSAVVASRLIRRVLHGEFSYEARQDRRLHTHATLTHSRAVADLYAD